MAPQGAETVKRVVDLVRQILIAVEEHEHGYAPQTIDVPVIRVKLSVSTLC